MSPSRLPLVLATVAAALLLATAVLSASDVLAAGVSVALFALIGFTVFVDALDLVFRLYLRRLQTGAGTDGLAPPTSIAPATGDWTPYELRLHLRPYAIVASIYQAETKLDDFIDAMGGYRDRLWLIDDGSDDATVPRLQQAGFRCLPGLSNRKKPAAIRALLATLPPEIETVLVIDPDVRIRDSGRHGSSDLEQVIFHFQRSGCAAACPRLAIREDGWLADLQALEYSIAFSLGRKSLADQSITSGISLYRRDALESLLASHSLSVYGEDLENSIRLLIADQRVYYDGRLVIDTEAKRTLAEWFSQRVGWAYGFIRPFLLCRRELLRAASRRPLVAYHYLVYMAGFGLLLHPLRLLSLGLIGLSLANGIDGLLGLELIADWGVAHPGIFLALYLKYTAIVVLAYFGAVAPEERLRLLPVVPIYFFYALLQVVPTTVGFGNWISLRLAGRRLFRDHYQDDDSLVGQERRARPARETEAGTT